MDTRAPSPRLNKGGSVEILALLKDDEKDREMARMTDLLQGLVQRGSAAKRVDCATTLDRCDVGGASKLFVTGHSGFYTPGMKARTAQERKLGGFELDDVASVLFSAIVKGGVREVEFWCCESACKSSTNRLVGDPSGTAAQPLGLTALQQLNDNIKANSWADVSTVDYLCWKVTDLIQKDSKEKNRKLYTYPTFTITGLNGVGYITDKDTDIVTFDRSLLSEITTISEKEKLVSQGKGGKGAENDLKRANDRFEKHIASRSCHFVSTELDFCSLQNEISVESKFLKRIAAPKTKPKPLDGAFMTAMENLLRPVLQDDASQVQGEGSSAPAETAAENQT